MSIQTKPSPISPQADHPLSGDLAGLSPSVLGILAAGLQVRHSQDREFGRCGQPAKHWAAVASKWVGRMAAAALHDDEEQVLVCANELVGIGIAVQELRFEQLVSPDVLAQLADDPGLDDEDWETLDLCTPERCQDAIFGQEGLGL